MTIVNLIYFFAGCSVGALFALVVYLVMDRRQRNLRRLADAAVRDTVTELMAMNKQALEVFRQKHN